MRGDRVEIVVDTGDGSVREFDVVATKAGRRVEVVWSGRVLLGAMLAGWGLFNLVEGVIDHHILQVHHVIERYGLSVWDGAFLASGAMLIGVGWALARRPSR